jgi:thymidylate synthase (FAD)
LKLVYSPTVVVVGRQTVDRDALDRILADYGVAWTSDSAVGAEVLAETAGRVAYFSYSKPRPGGNAAYLNRILDQKHGSVIESAVWSFMVTGISRSMSHELIRHRVGTSLTELSQRFVDSSDCGFVIPPGLEEEVVVALRWSHMIDAGMTVEERYKAFGSCIDDTTETKCRIDEQRDIGACWIEAVATTQEAYGRISEYLAEKARRVLPDADKTDLRKYANQTARSVLPNATETKLFLTMNARSLRHFVELRATRHADTEIRRFACKLWEVLVGESKSLFGDFEKVPLPDGTYELTTPYRGV